MANLETKISHIFIHYYSNKSASTCKLFISQPNKNQEKIMGKLFGIVEINTPSRENTAIITQLVNHLEETYYSLSEDPKINLEKAFEQSLEETNQKFNQILEEKRFYLVGNLNEQTIKEKVSLAIGVIKNEQVFISYLNNIAVNLIHKTKQDFKLIDIKKLNQSNEDSQDKNTKLFSNFITGEVKSPDYLVLANSSFSDFITRERIQKTVTSLPIHKAAEYFKNSLLQHEGHNFAAIIIHNSLKEEGRTKEAPSVTSISELNYTESSTEKLLAPSFFTTVKTISKYAFNFIRKNKTDIKQINKEREMTSQPTDNIETKSSPIEKSKAIFSPIASGSKNVFSKSKKLILNKLTKSPGVNEKLYKLKKYLRLKLAYLGNYIKKIPNLSKILLTIAILFVILFIYSTSYFKHQQNKQTFSAEFQTKVEQIEGTINQAESNIIFGDEAKAKEEITQAQKVLNTLEVDSNNQRQKQEELSRKVEVVIAKLRHITEINEPVFITDLNAQQENNIDIQNLIYQDDNLFAFDSLNNNSYKINLNDRQINKVFSNLSDIGLITIANRIDDKILLYHDKHGLLEYSNEKYIPISIGLQPSGKISDFAVYNNRLYTVDTNSSQIYRHPQDGSDYSTGLPWLKDSLDLKTVNSIGIDTNIWLLTSDGQVVKLNKGRKQNFEIKNLEPGLDSPQQLFTNDETNYIYILEPKNKRIIALDKEGNLTTQYFSQQFSNLKTFAIFEKEKKIFIVNDNSIYFFNLTHL
jgi:hypothetical protein